MIGYTLAAATFSGTRLVRAVTNIQVVFYLTFRHGR
jgi:hypothetical protein